MTQIKQCLRISKKHRTYVRKPQTTCDVSKGNSTNWGANCVRNNNGEARSRYSQILGKAT